MFSSRQCKGELAEAFAVFGGEGKQAKLLEEDGVVVVDGKVDLDVYGCREIRFKELEFFHQIH